jgi:hypothetical protein
LKRECDKNNASYYSGYAIMLKIVYILDTNLIFLPDSLDQCGLPDINDGKRVIHAEVADNSIQSYTVQLAKY